VPQETANAYSLDVECVATGTGHNARSVAQIALLVRPAAYFMTTCLDTCRHPRW